MLTGSANQITIQKHHTSGKYCCCAKYDLQKKEWKKHTNSPNQGKASEHTLDVVGWPTSDGLGGTKDDHLTEEEVFRKLVVYNNSNYLIGGGTDGLSDDTTTDGIVDNHAYSVIEIQANVCKTGIDLLLVRNPWGKGGEIDNGQFMRYGTGWEEYHCIRDELTPNMEEDNGLFWVTKEEFFKYFPTIYVCVFNMTKLKNPQYKNDLNPIFDFTTKAYSVGVCKEGLPDSNYNIVETTYIGKLKFTTIEEEEMIGYNVADGITEFRTNPDKYIAIHYQTAMLTEGWPIRMHSYKLLHRDGTAGLKIADPSTEGKRTILMHVPKT